VKRPLGQRIAYAIAAPLTALIFSFAISTIVLEISGNSAIDAFHAMFNYAARTDSVVSILNRGAPLYLAGLAVAIGFKMNLFNIGVNGQYLLAALLAAAVGAAVSLPQVLHVALIMLVAVLVGALWSAIPATLKVTRGVSEVVSTIMLNYVALAIIGWTLSNYLRDRTTKSLQLQTPLIQKSGRIGGLNGFIGKFGIHPPPGSSLYGFVPIAVLVGVLFWIIVWKTRFGFDLRASGTNPSAARASGVDPRAMVFKTMILSGIFAGLVGLPDLFGQSHQYTLDFRGDYGFNGIGVALLGRNHPGGIALGAILFGFLERSAQILDIEGIPKEIVTIMKGIIIISVVIAYEVVGRIQRAQEARQAATAAHAPGAGPGAAPAEVVPA
jgi:ABC-type uncharacterized transport system permease subunit